MKKLLLGSLFSILISSGTAAEKCGQVPLLLKIKTDVSAISDLINPINAKILDAEGDLKSEIDNLDNSDNITDELKKAILDLDAGKVNTKNLSQQISSYISKATTECISVGELTQMIDALETVKNAAPYYKNFLKIATVEISGLEKYKAMIKDDITAMNGQLSADQTKEFLSKYAGNEISIALHHANEYLREVTSDSKALTSATEGLSITDIEKSFVDATQKVSSAINNLYKAAELSDN